MKKIVCFLLAVSLMLSLSVFSFADTLLTPVSSYSPEYGEVYTGILPYSLVNTDGQMWLLTGRSGNEGSWTLFNSSNGQMFATGGILTYVGSTSSQWQKSLFIAHGSYPTPNSPYYWANFIGRITDANGYVLQASDFDTFGMFLVSGNNLTTNLGSTIPASDNVYQWNDGFLQIAINWQLYQFSNTHPTIYMNVSNSSVVAPLTVEIETYDIYSNESSSYPFVFGSSAHFDPTTPPGPKDPNDASQYGDAEDQVQWYNDAYGSAVDPELQDKMSATTDMLLQEQEIEEQMIDGINQYAPAVDPANLTMPTQIVNGLRFIGTTFMGSYNALGDIGFVISFSMMLGVVLVLIGRGEGALARGMASSARAERNRIAEEKRVMYERRRYGQERNR